MQKSCIFRSQAALTFLFGCSYIRVRVQDTVLVSKIGSDSKSKIKFHDFSMIIP